MTASARPPTRRLSREDQLGGPPVRCNGERPTPPRAPETSSQSIPGGPCHFLFPHAYGIDASHGQRILLAQVQGILESLTRGLRPFFRAHFPFATLGRSPAVDTSPDLLARCSRSHGRTIPRRSGVLRAYERRTDAGCHPTSRSGTEAFSRLRRFVPMVRDPLGTQDIPALKEPGGGEGAGSVLVSLDADERGS